MFGLLLATVLNAGYVAAALLTNTRTVYAWSHQEGDPEERKR
jgi:hypothetical protein